MKNRKSSLRAGKAKRQVVTYAGVSWPRPLVRQLMKNGYVKNLVFDPRSRFNGCYAHPSYSLARGLTSTASFSPTLSNTASRVEKRGLPFRDSVRYKLSRLSCVS